METVLGILLLVMAVILVVCVLCQEGKDKRLSGTIAGVVIGLIAGNLVERVKKYI